MIDDFPKRRGIVTDFWLTGPSIGAAPDEDTVQPRSMLEPPSKGSIFRFFIVAPEGQEKGLCDAERERLYSAHFESMGAPHARPDTRRHPGMHRTATIDYIVLLTGEVTLLLDDDEIELKPLDVVVQRGANHAWVNRGDRPALIMAVLLDAPNDHA